MKKHKITIITGTILITSCITLTTSKVIYSHNQQLQTINELQQITNPNSESNGKWKGLCAKNSIHSTNDFIQTILKDPILNEHFKSLDKSNLTIHQINEPTKALVYHRSGETIEMTNKPINLPANDKYITDGKIKIRLQCCNNYIETSSTVQPIYDPPITTNYLIPPISSLTNHLTSSEGKNDKNHVTSVPEPSTLLMFIIGLLTFLIKHK